MEPSQNVQPAAPVVPTEPIIFDQPKKKSNGMLYGLIFAIILALGGIGFGVWAMMDGNSRAETAKKECKSIATVPVIDTDVTKCDVPDDDDDGTTTPTTMSSEKGYIYIGEWGIKIKAPDGLNYVSYRYASGEDGSSVAVWGTTSNALSEFANPYNNDSSPQGAISRSSTECQYSVLVFTGNGYYYCYSHPQAVYSETEAEQNIELQSVDLVQQMLSTASNYSAF